MGMMLRRRHKKNDKTSTKSPTPQAAKGNDSRGEGKKEAKKEEGKGKPTKKQTLATPPMPQGKLDGTIEQR